MVPSWAWASTCQARADVADALMVVRAHERPGAHDRAGCGLPAHRDDLVLAPVGVVEAVRRLVDDVLQVLDERAAAGDV